MALTADELKFYNFAKDALPPWIPDPDEFLLGAAKMFGSVKALLDYLFGQALISTATGATSTTPDWLNQHARDRGTARRDGEDDPTLRARLRTFPDALVRAVLLASVNEILVAAGISDEAAMVELPQHGAHSGSYTADASVGGTFTKDGSIVTFTPDGAWARPPYRAPALVPQLTSRLVFTGSASAGNDGSYVVSSLDGDGAVFTNAGGVAEADPTVAWEVQLLDPEGNVRTGFARAYSQRGYRAAPLRPARIVVILPFGTTAETAEAVREALRTKKAAGIALTIERRLVAP